MYATERQEHILAVIRAEGRAAVAALATDLDVTTETIRRDLDALEERGRLRRVHGGAVAAELGSLAELTLDTRSGERIDAKRAIAAATLRRIPDGSTLLLDAGSTTGAIAGAIVETATDRRRLGVITNALPIAAALHAIPGIEVTFIGGRLRGVTSASVGTMAVAQLAALRPDVVVLGTNGISADFGLSTPDEDEAATKAAMVRAARRRIVVADGSKLGVESLHSFAPLGELDVLVTDVAPDADLAAALDRAGVEVVIA